MQEERDSSSLNSRRKKPSLRLIDCFNQQHHHHQADVVTNGSINVSSSSSSSSSFSAAAGILPSPRKSPTAWIRSKAPEFPVIKDKYKKFTSRMGRHRRHSSADFSYDPLSYSRNFQEPDDPPDSYQSFTSRLPLSPLTSPPSSSASPGTKPSRKTVSEIPSSRHSSPVSDHARLSLDE